ncbi:uncharacterized protein LOC108736703 [Agrilus planipennis]|uniref:Uncharacterized protein LOC108736703 n=1 Tax=Agrilus planipennis TaxID=224129 RepID=A0A7F5QXQ2_AGRPL|nr:uncharacterized protein LOC108736703 [Agrilus planipennis]
MCDSSFVVIISVLISFEITVILPFNCPKDFTRFEKILGVIPTAFIDKKTFYTGNTDEPVTLECIMKCRKNETCAGFLLNYEVPACYFYETITDNDGQMTNEIDNNIVWFSKICVQGTIPAEKLCKEEWIFERISGATLIGNNTKTLPKKVTRDACQKKCLEEKSFSCRSIKFRKTKEKQGNMTLGTCSLSSADRHAMPFAYRASNYQDEYIDNSCATDNFQ